MRQSSQGSQLRGLASDATSTFGTRMITLFFGVLTGVMTARVLGPENRGIFSLVALFPASVATLSKLGQGQASIYFLRREGEDVSRIVSNVLFTGIVFGIVLVALVLVGREILVTTVLKGVPVWALLVVVPLIPLLLVEGYLYAVLQATNRFRVYNTRLIAEALITVSAMAFVLLVAHWGLSGALGVLVSVRLLMGSWILWTVHRDSPFRMHFDVSLFKRMVRYGAKSHAQIIASHFHFKADMYFVAYFLNPAQVAFYAIAARLAERIMYIPQSLGLALFPRLAGSQEARAHAMTARACRQTLVITASLALLVSVGGRLLIPLWYGQRYAPATTPLAYVAGGVVMMSLYVLLSRNFTSRNRQQINIIAAYVALGGNLALNVYLIPAYGIVGAAMATAASYSVSALILLVFFLRESGLAWHEVVILKRSDLLMWRRLLAGVWADLHPAKA